MRRAAIIFCILGIECLINYAAATPYLRLDTSLAPPYQTLHNEKLAGYAVDTVKCVLDKIGAQYQFNIVPPKRAQLNLAMGRSNGFFSSTSQSDLDKYAILSAPIVLEKWYWFSLTTISNTAPTLLIKYKIGVLRGSNQEKWLRDNNIPIYQSVNKLDSLLKLLQRRRIDLFIADDSVVRELNKNKGNTSELLYSHFEKYAPMGVYIANQVSVNHPLIMDEFNDKISECNQSNLFLSAHEKEKIENAVNVISASIISNPLLIELLEDENLKNNKMELSDILERDKEWRSIVAGHSTMPDWMSIILTAKISKMMTHLTTKVRYLTEIILTDERGILVAASNLTSDYWQGDEEKVLATLNMAKSHKNIPLQGRFDQSNNRHQMPSIEYDESSKRFLCRLSYPIWYKGSVIGILSFGINVENALLKI